MIESLILENPKHVISVRVSAWVYETLKMDLEDEF